MVVALVANYNWYKYMMIDVYALIKTTKDLKKIYLFTETDNIDDIPYLRDIIEKNKNIDIVVVNANKLIERNINYNSINRNSFFTNFCMVKLMLSDIVEEDKILYIDTDAIVRKDISNLWKYNINDYYVAGVKDFGILKRGNEVVADIVDSYINSGFVLFNLKKMREDNIQQKIFDIINTRELRFPDQDALNLVCHGRIMFLPSMYNLCEDVTLAVINKDLVRVYHFGGYKDFWVANRYYAEEWYEVEEAFYNEYGWPE